MFWGLSPALDLQDEYTKHVSGDGEELNIILFGSCDGRHILKTMSKSYMYKYKKINMIIIENCLELVARQLMLILTALESPKNLGILDKTRMYLEIYGNTVIRSSTSKYIMFKSNQMIKMITDLNYLKEIAPNINFDKIKYKERDYIEMLLQFWRTCNTNRFDICELWNKRIRSHLGTRYDAKQGVFDWDYHMRFKDAGASTVSIQEYKHFRNTGVSFTWLDLEICRPNCTLAAGVIKSGDDFHHRGYVGDIVTGPYLAYGLDCDDETMMQKCNGVHVKRSTDISERNVMKMLHELDVKKETEGDFFKSVSNRNLGLVSMIQSDVKLSEDEDFINADYDLNAESLNVDNVNVSFYSPKTLQSLGCEDGFKCHFDIMYVSHVFSDKIDSNFIDMLKFDGLLIMESRKFIIDAKKSYVKAFEDVINNIEIKCNCVRITDFDSINDEFARLKRNLL